ncbi:translesion DNA synthesis-associated protein ImuA [Sinimarinibacterium flocculans]|uniref:Cell division inhibitor SulA/protein ImuA n=1 Tax=Sinimarinibacterium flocculans TaxID=985250 RepID=A0A318EQ04_9GAMM|nr:translesion DNA synthesis-associated protein ImuA [Sinimarinibacterium flocculans]PXV71566.1 cell division inhibitor SulA/protein ImuA [Sinimarinibacterium flocculans]
MSSAPSAAAPRLDQIPGIWRGQRALRVQAMPTGHADLDRLLPGGGLPCNALTEILHPRPGVGEMGLILPMLGHLTQAGSRVGLIAPPHVPYAPALARASVVLPRLVVVDPPASGEPLWCVEQMLRAGVFGAIVGWIREADMHALRRLQLAAVTGHTIGVLMRPMAAELQPSPAALRLKLTRVEQRLDVEVLKARGGRIGDHWQAA